MSSECTPDCRPITDPCPKQPPAAPETDVSALAATPLDKHRHRCKAHDHEVGRCRLYLGHDGKHGDGEGTVWGKDWTGARAVISAWEQSPLLRSIKAARNPGADR